MPDTSLSNYIPTPSKENLYRGYNLIVAGLVTYEYLTNDAASALEYLPDICIHLFEAVKPHDCGNIAIVANAGRAVQAGYSFFSGNSTIPSAANFFDVGNHTLNIYHRISDSQASKETVEHQDTKPKIM